MLDSDSDTERDTIELESALLIENNKVPVNNIVNNKQIEICKKTLELNKKCDDILKILQYKLKTCHSICNKKLESVRHLIHSKPEKRTNTFNPDSSYYKLGCPYFKDADDFPAPPNSDVNQIRKYNVFKYPEKRPIKWTPTQKSALLKTVHSYLIKKREKETLFDIKRIEREISDLKKTESSEYKTKKKELKLLLKTNKDNLVRIKHRSLESLVKPLKEKEEFDWDSIRLEGGKAHSESECRIMWQVFLHPEISKKGWGETEQFRLKRIASQHKFQDWESIAQTLNTQRSFYQCFLFFRLRLDNSNDKYWSQQEDNYLKSLVQNCKIGNFIPWSKIAYFMENRTKTQCYNRWMYAISCNSRRFMPEEDDVIMAGVREFGKNFNYICQFLPSRKPSLIKRRYETLSFSLNGDRFHSWTPDSDKTLWILTSRAKQTNNKICFSSLCKYFPGKSVPSIKKRYQLLERWLEKSEENTIENAPKRSFRNHKPDIDFNAAVQQLQNKECNNENKTDNMENYRIHRRLTAYFKELDFNNEIHQLDMSPQTQTDYVNLRNILLLLGAKLNRKLLDTNLGSELSLNDIINNLTRIEELPSSSQKKVMKTYSRKNKIQSVPSESDITRTNSINISSPSIWSDNKNNLGTDKPLYVLPPTFNTMIAFKTIMLQNFKTIDTVDEKYNKEVVSHVNRFNSRFDTLFMWAANLTNIPSYVHGTIFDDDSTKQISHHFQGCSSHFVSLGTTEPSVSTTDNNTSSRKRKREVPNLIQIKRIKRKK